MKITRRTVITIELEDWEAYELHDVLEKVKKKQERGTTTIPRRKVVEKMCSGLEHMER